MLLTMDIHVNAAGRLSGTLKPGPHGPEHVFDGALELLALLEAIVESFDAAPPGPEPTG